MPAALIDTPDRNPQVASPPWAVQPGTLSYSLNPPDEQLLKRIANGDRPAMEILFHRYRSVAYRVAYRLLGCEADALDAVQNGFVKALTNLGSFRQSSSFKTWLMRIVSNAALDLGRQRKRERERTPDIQLNHVTDEGKTPDSELDREDLRRSIDMALAQLPEAQRRTFVLHVDAGMSYREVADTLGISIGTVMSRLYYARQKLQGLLAEVALP